MSDKGRGKWKRDFCQHSTQVSRFAELGAGQSAEKIDREVNLETSTVPENVKKMHYRIELLKHYYCVKYLFSKYFAEIVQNIDCSHQKRTPSRNPTYLNRKETQLWLLLRDRATIHNWACRRYWSEIKIIKCILLIGENKPIFKN